MKIEEAKSSLDTVIRKSRVHLYKPIQVAEILFRKRTVNDINFDDLETYRNPSKLWRNEICLKFIGRISTSSQKYQDDLFNKHATVDGRDKLSQKWSFKNEPPGKRAEFNDMEIPLTSA